MRTGTLFGRPATEATIWVNGFYTGDPVAFDIFPPPRPSPDSLLAITKPIDADAEFHVDSAFSVVDDSHVRVSFSASPRQVEVTGAGEMKWEHGRPTPAAGTWAEARTEAGTAADMVAEQITWFEDLGSPILRQELVVRAP